MLPKQKKKLSETRRKKTSPLYPGFSMLELIIVIAIIIIALLAGIASMSGVRSNAALKSSQRELTAAIKQAQSYALQGKTQNGKTPCGYGLIFTDNKTYVVYYNALDGSGGFTNGCQDQNTSTNYLHYRSSSPASGVVSTSALPNGTITTESSLANTDIYFTVPNSQAFNGAGVSYPGRSITLDYNGKQVTLDINTRGGVSEP